MPGILLSGPAGGGKSQLVRDLLRKAAVPTVAADFQSLVVALLLLEREPATGLYPVRPEWVLPLAEYARQAIITGATAREISVITTNSDGNPERRRSLLARLGPGATERIVDPGIDPLLKRGWRIRERASFQTNAAGQSTAGMDEWGGSHG